MIYLKIENMEYYDDAIALLRSFYPRAEVTTTPCDDAQQAVEAPAVPGGMMKKEARDWFKTTFYRQLQAAEERDLPWGDLLGVRPGKLAVSMLEEGAKDEDVLAFFVQQHRVSEKKARLALKIAKKELKLLEGIAYEKGYSLYAGIPFCPTTCLYCSFTSYPMAAWAKDAGRYLERLKKEMDFVAEQMKGRRLNAIYFGGGTPTALSAAQLDWTLSSLRERFDVKQALEFTVEAGRPDSITGEKLEVLKKHGVSRISINPQTMNQKTLDVIGRRHTVEQVKEAFCLAREKGFDNINMDLILALPGEGPDEVRHTLEEIRALGPESLTVHSLAIKRAAALNTEREKYRGLPLFNSDEMVDETAECAAKMGMEAYYMYRQKHIAGNFENVGYSIPGKECLYNVLIMEEKQTIIACGAGASTKMVLENGRRIERIENVKDVRHYMDRIDEMIGRKAAFFEKNKGLLQGGHKIKTNGI